MVSSALRLAQAALPLLAFLRGASCVPVDERPEQCVPAAPDSRGLAFELAYGSTNVPSGFQFNNILPPPGLHVQYDELAAFAAEPRRYDTSVLVALVVAQVDETSTTTAGTTKTLRESTTVDLTKEVKGDVFTWTAGGNNASWEVFAFYERPHNSKCRHAITRARVDPDYYGSWVVDHFSTTGAKMVTDFGDRSRFEAVRVRSVVEQAEWYSWEDSLTELSSIWWTPGFLERFGSSRGYNVAKFLPALFGSRQTRNTRYIFDTDPEGKHLASYKQTLKEAHQEYLGHLRAWARSKGVVP